jgi:anti-sigma factor ChrR (cupin superfamily)
MKIIRRTRKAASDATLDKALIARLSDAVTPVDPPAALADRMRQRVMDSSRTGTTVLRASDGEWKKLLPGITIKTLHIDRDSGTQTSLWRLQPGARIPPHPHSKAEECLILEGTIIHNDITYQQGDFLLATPGERHQDFIAPNGALLMIRGERIPNRLLLHAAMLLPH